MVRYQIITELGVTHLISVLKLTIIWSVLLNRIIRQMHPLVLQLFCISTVGRRAGPDISFFEKHYVHILRHEHPYSDVKLAPMNE